MLLKYNYKQAVIVLLLLFTSSMLKAQQPPVHIPLMTSIWKMIGEKQYQQNKAYKWVAKFPEKLKKMENKEIELPGYIIPLEADFEHRKFMLAILPYEQCAFCGQGDIPVMTEVHMEEPIRHTDKPVKIRGILRLNETGDDRSEVFLVRAKAVQ